MKGWHRLGCLWLLAVLVTACGGDEGSATQEGQQRVGGVARQEPEATQAPVSDVQPLEEPVEMEMSATLDSARRLTVEGKSNLPDATRLQVVVEREQTRVNWRDRTEIEEGRFTAGPMGSGSGLPDGGYRITVNMLEASVQPPDVQRRIGEEGQHLEGPLVTTSRHGLGQVVTDSRRFVIGEDARRTDDRVEVLQAQ